MEWTALVISIVAMLIAGASAFYTRQQAQAARDTAKIDRERRLAETAPDLDATIENMGGWNRVWLRIKQAEPLTRLDAEIVAGRGISFSRSVDGVDPSQPYPVLRAFYLPSYLRSGAAALHSGDAACWRVDLQEDRADIAHLRVTCHGSAQERWIVHKELNMAPIDRSIA